jgi:hypothetical protein
MRSRIAIGSLGGAALAALLLAPVHGDAAKPRKRVRAAATSLSSIGSFTPASADPRFGGSMGRIGIAGNSGFRFTPSAAPGESRRVTVAVRTRSVTPTRSESQIAGIGSVNAYAYNLGASVGWKRFALTGDYAKVDLGPIPGSRESADVALSYAGHGWSGRVALGADRPLGDVPRLLAPERNVSVDLGGSYSINNRLDVIGGVRYRTDREQIRLFDDERRDSQAVYIGTAFRF